MAPYTTVLPKPLMPIGDVPIVEIVVRQLKAAGIDRITMSVGHLAELLRAFFGDGSRLGVQLDYVMEDEPLGTVGPLALIDDLDDSFLLMNGDVLTDLDYRDFVRSHRDAGGVATIATYLRNVYVDFGVIEADSAGLLTGYVEKPTLNYAVSMGIYLLEPRILQHIQKGVRLDFPDLIKLLIARGERVVSYRHRGYWLDIGRPEDHDRAVQEFASRRSEFLRPGKVDSSETTE
jgi:NDP-sugar pyrophosphorylase family protein